MARVTVEDCIDKVESPYELVLVAKERAAQLNSGIEPTLDRDNDKNTVISLREIAEEKIKVSDLRENAIYKLRKHVEQITWRKKSPMQEGAGTEGLTNLFESITNEEKYVDPKMPAAIPPQAPQSPCNGHTPNTSSIFKRFCVRVKVHTKRIPATKPVIRAPKG